MLGRDVEDSTRLGACQGGHAPHKQDPAKHSDMEVTGAATLQKGSQLKAADEDNAKTGHFSPRLMNMCWVPE